MGAILNPKQTQDLLFDESFRTSRLYFEVLQVLRIFSDRIRETGKDLRAIAGQTDFFTWKNLQGGFNSEEDFDYQYEEIIRDNWEIVTKYQAEAEQKLLARILDKTEEMKSLRDGVHFQIQFIFFLYF
jgi:hypothetical protein